MIKLGAAIDVARVVAPETARNLQQALEALSAFSPPDRRAETLAWLRGLTVEQLADIAKPLMTILPTLTAQPPMADATPDPYGAA